MSAKPQPGFTPDDLTARLAQGYWAESRRPWASLVFIAPLLLVYEAGLLVLGPHAVRNGADAWLRSFLEGLGFGEYFLLPVLTVIILLAWQHTTRQPWRLRPGLFWGMTGECILLAFVLLLILHLQRGLSHAAGLTVALDGGRQVGNVIGYLGAGIYEELLFRMMLLSGMIWLLGWMRVEPGPRRFSAVVASSLLFAAAHYVGPYGYTLAWFSFLFRFVAGVFFAVLFLYRGFGIAAGAHAGYDILVGLSAGN
jgi:membrane protease YdiL (CAAX protease family)